MATMIKEPYHCTFIHIPKTGGNSITNWMQKNFKAIVTKREQHATRSEAEKRLGDLGWTFCVVRNPWDYLVSWYTFKVHLADSYIKLLQEKPELQKNHKKKYDLEYQKNQKERLSNGFKWWVSQTNVPSQYKRAKDIDYIMKLENLTNDFQEIQKKLNCFEPLDILNKTPNKKKYYEYYDNETIEIVKRRYSIDIENLGYNFE